MSFWELLVVAVVGLLVIGPDKLPETIKTGLVWVRRIRRMLNETRSEIESQLGVDEIKREIHNQEVLESLKALNIAQQEAQKNLASVADAARENLKIDIREDFAEDEGLFGDQRSNHPPEIKADSETKPQAKHRLESNLEPTSKPATTDTTNTEVKKSDSLNS